MPMTGLEPVRAFGPRDFKSLASAYSATSALKFSFIYKLIALFVFTKLLIATYKLNSLEAPPRIELGMKVLQTSALPLGYGATFN